MHTLTIFFKAWIWRRTWRGMQEGVEGGKEKKKYCNCIIISKGKNGSVIEPEPHKLGLS